MVESRLTTARPQRTYACCPSSSTKTRYKVESGEAEAVSTE
jgi:hypothetical protein